MPLEIASFSSSSAILALSTNAVDRIELCADPSVGGITPSLSSLQDVLNHTTSYSLETRIPINVMIRPRGGDFIYTDDEFGTMLSEIKTFSDAGANGFVFGILRRKGENDGDQQIDTERCKALLAVAGSKPCTFHRAFDQLPPETMLDQLEVLIKLGFNFILTSGDGKTAVEGQDMLQALVEQARGRINIMVGGGVRSKNLKKLREVIYAELGAEETHRGWWHSSAIVDGGDMADKHEVLALCKASIASKRGSTISASWVPK